MFVAVLGDVLVSGHLSLMPPWLFGALIFAVFGFMLHAFATARQQSELLATQATQMKIAGARLQQSLGDAAAMNAKLHQSEARYKGLVDAQGDPIFRRLPDSRLSYGNDAFFKLFGLKAIEVIGQL